MTENDKMLHYAKCVNQVEDLFEYRYRSMGVDDIRKEINEYIDELAKKLKEK